MILPVVLYGCQLGLSQYGKAINGGCLRTGRWGAKGNIWT